MAGVFVNQRRPLGFAGLSALPLAAPRMMAGAASAAAPSSKPRKATSTVRGTASKVVGISGATSERSREELKEAVKEAQAQYLLSRGRRRFEDVPDSELDTVEGPFKMRKAAAQACRALLADARATWAERKASNDGIATRTTGICVLSAYRSYAHDTRAWSNAFATHYENTRSRRAGLPGGAHGDAAVHALMLVMKDKKAPPGFSNHSNGTAVDFGTTVDGKLLLTDTHERNRAAWRSTWLHAWLVANGPRYGFHPLGSEEWHWDYR